MSRGMGFEVQKLMPFPFCTLFLCPQLGDKMLALRTTARLPAIMFPAVSTTDSTML